MSTPPMLHRHDASPTSDAPRHDPVAGVTSAVLVILMAGLFVLAVMVVATYRIQKPDASYQAALSPDFVAPFATVLALVFFASLVFNVVAKAVRHFRSGH